MTTGSTGIDQDRSADRIGRDIETLSGSDYTLSDVAIRRYAYTTAYENALRFVTGELESLGFVVERDPVGNLVARNRPKGEPVFGIGSHCDSNRNGGRYDGTLGVVAAVEICRLNDEHGLRLPLQVVSFLEEEGSGFGVGLLGSRIVAQRVTEEELEAMTAIDDGRSFWAHAEEAGYEPARWRECERLLDDLTGWIELHIEQGRVLQDTGSRIGIVDAIAGIHWADVTVRGRGDHAGATPMDFRLDPAIVAAESILELERLARTLGKGTVGTVGEIDFRPGLINAIAERARFSIDIRAADRDSFEAAAADIAAFAGRAAVRRGMSAVHEIRQHVAPTPLDGRVVGALGEAARRTGEPSMLMPSGAGHDTMCIADRVPSAMVFVPCKDGISHHPDEEADPADAALGVGVMLAAIRRLVHDR